MSKPRITEWRKLPMALSELCLATTLRCGQSFRWRKSPDDIWSLALHGRVVSLRQDSEHLHYRAVFPDAPASSISAGNDWTKSDSDGDGDRETDNTLALVRHYLNLGPNLGELYRQWSAADPNFARKAAVFTGIRILQQDAWEALCGFICSSNNNISRISSMVSNLCTHFGPFVAHHDGFAYHDFPTPEALTGGNVEQKLRELGFGYRAKYIHQTAVMVANKEGGLAWLDGLKNPERPVLGKEARPAGELTEGGREGYKQAHQELLTLQGVGPKVADCVCLMGLCWGESVPIDTHVYQIAQRDYKFTKGKQTTMNKTTYDAVANKFRQLWGIEAGWAHSVLFTADLKSFSERLTATKTEAMDIKVEETTIDSNPVTLKTKAIRVKEETLEGDSLLKTESRSKTTKRKPKAQLNGATAVHSTTVVTRRSKRIKHE